MGSICLRRIDEHVAADDSEEFSENSTRACRGRVTLTVRVCVRGCGGGVGALFSAGGSNQSDFTLALNFKLNADTEALS